MTDWPASSVLSTAIALFLALLFARAALHKLDDRERFGAVFEAYRLAPPALSAVIAPLELAAAALVLTPWTFSAGLGLMTLLLLGYGAAMGINLARGRGDIDCGCGGQPEPLSWALVGRNALLACAAAMAAIAGPAQSAAAVGVAAALALTAFMLWLGGAQAARNHVYWRARRAEAAADLFQADDSSEVRA